MSLRTDLQRGPSRAPTLSLQRYGAKGPISINLTLEEMAQVEAACAQAQRIAGREPNTDSYTVTALSGAPAAETNTAAA